MVYSKMIRLQKELIKSYSEIENLPRHPVDLQAKYGQKLVKDFIHRFNQELGEAYESLEDAFIAMDSNNPILASQYIEDHNIEVADCWHFLLEILIFMGYEESVPMLLEKHVPEKYHALIKPDMVVYSLLNVGGMVNFEEGLKNDHPSNFNISFSGHYTHGNTRISLEVLKVISRLSWDVFYKFSLLVNRLKNRDHSVSERGANIPQVEEMLTLALISWGRYLEYGKFTCNGILHFYEKKNLINKERIKNKY